MLKLNAKYEQLKLWLGVEGYNVSEFEETTVAMLYGSYFLLDTGKQNFSISVFQDQEKDALEVLVEEKIDETWFIVEQKFYKNVKYAFNFIVKVLNY